MERFIYDYSINNKMKLYQKILATGALITGLAGCNNKPKILEGILKEEFGTIHMIVEGKSTSNNANLNYGMVLKNNQGEYFISIYTSDQNVFPFAKSIKPGDKIKITGFDGDQRVGAVNLDNIEVIERRQ